MNDDDDILGARDMYTGLGILWVENGSAVAGKEMERLVMDGEDAEFEACGLHAGAFCGRRRRRIVVMEDRCERCV